MISDNQAMEILKTLADANRMQLFRHLLRSDHTNSELMEYTQLSQNLLSHHLNVLSGAGLIQAQRSVGDARRHYYSANLDMVVMFGHWWDAAMFSPKNTFPVVANPPEVLFLCLRNSTRSLMAETIARNLAPQTMHVWSAGVQEGGKVEPEMTQVLAEHRLPSDHLRPVLFNRLGKRDFDYVITVCDIVHEGSIPSDLRAKEILHWSLRDPGAALDPERKVDEARQLYHEITQRLMGFVQRVLLAN